MSVKIDKYIIVDNCHEGVDVVDQTRIMHRYIVGINTGSKDVDMILAQLCLDELNTGKYELEFLDKGDD